MPGTKRTEMPPSAKLIEPDWTAKSAPVMPAAQSYAVGLKVFHPKFGEGEITAIADRRDDQELVIEFKRHDTKRLLASLAKLDVID